jgi:hypothetical protein
MKLSLLMRCAVRATFSVSCLLGMGTFSGCALFLNGYECCYRKFSDEEIDQLLVEKLHITKPHRNDVQWKHCEYFVVIWPVPNVVDGQTIVELDQDGKIIRGPR